MCKKIRASIYLRAVKKRDRKEKIHVLNTGYEVDDVGQINEIDITPIARAMRERIEKEFKEVRTACVSLKPITIENGFESYLVFSDRKVDCYEIIR